MFKQYQTVELTHSMMSDDLIGDPVYLPKGKEGVIVAIHRAPGLPIGYDVEFFGKPGETIALMILMEDQIRPVTDSDPPPAVSNKKAA